MNIEVVAIIMFSFKAKRDIGAKKCFTVVLLLHGNLLFDDSDCFLYKVRYSPN